MKIKKQIEEVDLEKKSTVEHFKDLKTLVVHIGIVFVLSFCTCYYFSAEILRCLHKYLIPQEHLYYFSILEPFFLQLKISFVSSLMVSIPFIIFRVMAYLMPVFHGKRNLVIYSILSIVLFASGTFLGFFLFIPKVVEMLLHTNTLNMPMALNASTFFETVTMLLLVFGGIFEVPLVIFFLLQGNIITIKQMKKFRKFNLILSFILGAVLTPPDVISQIIVAMMLIFFFEASLFVFSLCKGTKE